ncbi:hypothetical protein EG68_10556 [Paragonimus skrjabini miyazakii]|uniref:Uncharacterized protein n=1 Tax=Paragonimus skrjabini miyazakii TaxID=59628 RepID=A0A8S9YFH7_9TREM|nr:hypothetical protein EG68_10556 [Paragonimus skrjabini miyazakii]
MEAETVIFWYVTELVRAVKYQAMYLNRLVAWKKCRSRERGACCNCRRELNFQKSITQDMKKEQKSLSTEVQTVLEKAALTFPQTKSSINPKNQRSSVSCDQNPVTKGTTSATKSSVFPRHTPGTALKSTLSNQRIVMCRPVYETAPYKTFTIKSPKSRLSAYIQTADVKTDKDSKTGIRNVITDPNCTVNIFASASTDVHSKPVFVYDESTTLSLKSQFDKLCIKLENTCLCARKMKQQITVLSVSKIQRVRSLLFAYNFEIVTWDFRSMFYKQATRGDNNHSLEKTFLCRYRLALRLLQTFVNVFHFLNPAAPDPSQLAWVCLMFGRFIYLRDCLQAGCTLLSRTGSDASLHTSSFDKDPLGYWLSSVKSMNAYHQPIEGGFDLFQAYLTLGKLTAPTPSRLFGLTDLRSLFNFVCSLEHLKMYTYLRENLESEQLEAVLLTAYIRVLPHLLGDSNWHSKYDFPSWCLRPNLRFSTHSRSHVLLLSGSVEEHIRSLKLNVLRYNCLIYK